VPLRHQLSQVTITDERAKVVDFSEPYFDSNQGVLVKKGTKVASLAAAKNLKWGAQLNTTGAYISDTIRPTTEARVHDRTTDATSGTRPSSCPIRCGRRPGSRQARRSRARGAAVRSRQQR
jgi:hypothetical protein